MNQTNGISSEDQVALLSRQHREAAIRGDTQALSLILAAEWMVVGPLGNVENKEQQARKFQDGSLKFTAIEPRELEVRGYGDAAVVAGLYHIKATIGGQQIDGLFRHTDIFAKQGGGSWRCVFTQSTRVVSPPVEKP